MMESAGTGTGISAGDSVAIADSGRRRSTVPVSGLHLRDTAQPVGRQPRFPPLVPGTCEHASGKLPAKMLTVYTLLFNSRPPRNRALRYLILVFNKYSSSKHTLL